MATRVVDNQSIVLINGDHKIENVTIPDSVNSVQLQIARKTSLDSTTWADPNTKLTVRIEISFDDGKTYEFQAGGTFSGGILTRSDGSEFAFTPIHVTGIRTGRNRLLRVALKVENGPLDSRVNADVEQYV